MAPKESVNEQMMSRNNSETSYVDNTKGADFVTGDVATTGTTVGNNKKGFHLRWSRLHKVVDLPRNDAGLMGRRSLASSAQQQQEQLSTTEGAGAVVDGSKKTILKSVSGYAAPGQVLACMGPSGSGKTSLLNVLSGRSVYQSGCISIDGERINPTTMKRLQADIAYVKQADVFFGHLTVRDQLTYTALLRIGKEKLAEVDRVLKLLRLNKVADSPIRMLSGGEKKRVNIGTELLTDPACFVLDEPTSGLDSTSAVALLRLLRTLAVHHGKTVITSMHQPSSAVFHSFDRLMLLSEGNVVYFGTPADSLVYLSRQNLECPAGYNGADYWMDLLVNDSSNISSLFDEDDDNDAIITNEHEALAAAMKEAVPGALLLRQRERHQHTPPPRLLLEQAWDHEAVAEEMDRALPAVVDTKTMAEKRGGGGGHGLREASSARHRSKYNTTWLTQYYILTHRALKNSRSAIFTPLNLIKSLAIGLVAGMIWFQTEYTEKNVNDIRSYYFFTMTFWVFDAMFTALMSLPAERNVILKERASGSYHLSAYFMAKTTADVPVRMILPLLYMAVSFWMSGISSSFSVFFESVGCTLLSVVAGEALGLLVGAAVYDMEKGMTIMTVFTLFLMLLGGFFVEYVPVFIAWGKFISPFKYAFDSSLQLVFDRPVPCDGSGALEELCGNGGSTGSASAESVLGFIGVQGSVAFNVGILLVMCFLPRYLAYVALRMKRGDDRT